MKAITEITAEKFKEATGHEDTGHEDTEDDLERCNCPKAGELGHNSCGWNYSKNLPVFMVGEEKK